VTAASRPAALDEPYRPPPGEPVLVHADDAILVLEKAAGLLCAPGRGEDKQDCLVSRAQARWPGALLVHRLDLATSGLVLLARTPAAHARLSAAFRERAVAKRYEGLVHGPLPGDGEKGEIDLPLLVDWPNRPLQKVCAEGKPSLTRWRRLGNAGDGIVRVALEPVTGRSHQLRVHLAASGCPLLGDPLYGRPGDGAGRLMLHATRMAFAHPVSRAPVEVESPAPF
jgi:tRNA pseudouridine32 synthase/23S rRNA pseudouridine746 synthase